MTERNFEALPPFALAIEAATKTKTRIGAIALSAPTKSVPRMPQKSAQRLDRDKRIVRLIQMMV